jgi:hypothetical protein
MPLWRICLVLPGQQRPNLEAEISEDPSAAM